MSIAVAVKKFSGREYVYIYENYRDPTTRRPTSRVLKSFGRKDKLLAENPNAMALIEEQAQKLRANSDTYQQTLEPLLGAGVHMAPTRRDTRPQGLSCTPAPYFRLWITLGRVCQEFRVCDGYSREQPIAAALRVQDEVCRPGALAGANARREAAGAGGASGLFIPSCFNLRRL